MKAFFRTLYLELDRRWLSKMSASGQLRIKRSMLAVGRSVFPGAISPELTAERMVQHPTVPLSLPNWALEEMAQISVLVDPQLHPETFFAASPETYRVPLYRTGAGTAYFRLAARVTGRVDAILFVPDLGHGIALQHARALGGNFGLRTLVVVTDARASAPLAALPEGVQVLEAGAELRAIPDAQDVPAVLARLVLQLGPSMLHVIDSDPGWETLACHGQAMAQQSRVYATVRRDELDAAQCPRGTGSTYLTSTSRWVTGFITDDIGNIEDWAVRLGVDRRLFHVVPLPGSPTCDDFLAALRTVPGYGLRDE